MIEVVNKIRGHALTLISSEKANVQPFGWIRLFNDAGSAGYVYLQDEPIESHLSEDNSYIVTSLPFSFLSTILDVLRNEPDLQLRFFNPESDGSKPSVFFEPSPETKVLPAELQSMLKKQSSAE